MVLMAVASLLPAGYTLLLVGQMLLSAVASIALWDAGNRLGSSSAGLVAALAFGLNPEVWRYNETLQTESVYASLIAMLLWSVVWASGRGGGRTFLLSFGVAILLASLRQQGWMMPPAVALLFIPPKVRVLPRVALMASVLVLAALALVASPFGKANTDRQSPASKLAAGQIYADTVRPRVPIPPTDVRDLGFKGVAQIALEYPAESLHVAAWRVAASVVHIRPSRFPLHRNIGDALYLLAIYTASAISLRRQWHLLVVRFASAVIVLHLTFIAITWEDYYGRFQSYYLPALCLLAGLSLLRRRGDPDRVASPPESTAHGLPTKTPNPLGDAE